jgi:hypothetical protein
MSHRDGWPLAELPAAWAAKPTGTIPARIAMSTRQNHFEFFAYIGNTSMLRLMSFS